jgi:hypothetical protein
MCHETIRRAVVQKFNEAKGWNCKDIDEVYDKINDRKEANKIVNSLKICDPAVGSGHFLVSALNEILAIKHELKILSDREGKRLKEYTVSVENDELIIMDDDDTLFEYNPKLPESQRVQETLFHEKQTIIENCLFGVDINPNSVKICRLRLWIELLKNAYYKNETELETLPNIDINIKCGNSLVSRFDIKADLSKALKKSKFDIDSYRDAVHVYQNAKDKVQKRKMQDLINEIKGNFRIEIYNNDPKFLKLHKLRGEIFTLTNQQNLFEMSKKEKTAWEKKITLLTSDSRKLETKIDEIKNNKIYENAFEWRFEFPEVLDSKGDFIGFDIIIGNPPYIPLEDFNESTKKHFKVNYPFVERKYETSVLFIILGLRLLNKNKNLSYIAPITWQTGENYKKLREQLFNDWGIQKIINLPFNIFADAYVDTALYFLSNKTEEKYNIFTFGKKDDHNELKNMRFDIILKKLVLKPKYKVIINPFVYKIINRIKHENFTQLGEISISTQGLSPSKFPQVNEKDRNLSFLYLQLGNVYNYCLKINQTYQTTLAKMESLIPFYEENEKILIRRLINRQDRLTVGYTSLRLVFKKDINPFIITDKSIKTKYLLGILASKFISFYYVNTSSIALKDDFRQTTLSELREILIPNINAKEQMIIIKLVNKMLACKNGTLDTDPSLLESEIDQLVYKLYGLTEEEIVIVEGKNESN